MSLVHRLQTAMLLLAAVVLLACAAPASAQTPAAQPPSADLAPALEKIAADSYSDTEAALALLSTSTSPQAAVIVAALADGRLLIDAATKSVYVRAADGTLSAAATGATVSPAPAGLKAVRLNNRVRRAIDAASGALSLLAPEPARRAEAAAAVFKSRDAAALPTLQAAIAKETIPSVREALEQARAAILITAPGISEADRLGAVKLVTARGDQEALALLSNLPADATPAVKTTAEQGVAAINRSLAMWNVAQNVWYGLSLGSVLLLAAIGLAITFGVMGVINMAHGEMVMLGAYTTYMVQDVIRTSYPGLFGWSLAIALPLAFLFTALVGILIERLVIRFLYGRALETLLATWGLSLMLQQAVRTIFGPTNKEVGAPSWMSGAFQVGQLSITYNRLWIIVFALIVFVALLVVLKRTSLGLYVRAVTQNRRMAAAMGIRTGRIDALTFGLGSGIAGIAGVALSQIDNVSPNLGQGYIIDSFMVVVFGGVGNLWGTLVGAFTLGIANKLLEPFAGAVLGKIVLLVCIILFIQKRPRGLFALKGRAVEA
ncbi:branched-chain amino acid ABC transporter permease [Azorhizobium oxalatiphilum]|uniref:Branched-chain amino acid ABC transporter permease n=1 Tax=Azorhizobium oxalatiphilum TaxID=980631 RepID=A0A917C534_9HYPH|nr:urea ABC transporter permease subunit UrtB [Azorhizobium oxalatiphilum]GGF72239.1 branched-chain amino acid ABC transporter permease [Azorhizobium oxalatiphilum]